MSDSNAGEAGPGAIETRHSISPVSEIAVGFRYIDSRDWQGGYNYLLNLCTALKKHSTCNIRPKVFCGIEPPAQDKLAFTKILDADWIQSETFAPQSLRRRRWRTVLSGCDQSAAKEFQKHRIDIVFENADFYGKNFPFPVIAWIPDFQHRHLPKMFSSYQYWKRELGFRWQIAGGRKIMVSSEDAKADCERFYRVAKGQVTVIPFAVPLGILPSDDEANQVRQKYDLPPVYFFLANQFWRHKNHDVVLEAIDILAEQKIYPVIAVTGAASHPTNIKVLSNLEAKVTGFGLANQFRLLGKVPYKDLLGLMAGCRALINPSRFEGWSTPIEEAKAMGIDLILSDLNVHREQVGQQAKYFAPSDRDALSVYLVDSMNTARPPRLEQDQLQQRSESRMRSFVDNFESLVRTCVPSPEAAQPADDVSFSPELPNG